jgi:ribosomal peptide maturation radical SAM protein 1
LSDVVFVQMPFAGVERPSLALGLLTASLRAAGIATESVYANIAFAEKVGLLDYILVRASAPSVLIGEWIFAESAFGEAVHRLPELNVHRGQFDFPDDGIDLVLKYRGVTDLNALMTEVRRKATELVEELSREIVRRGPKVVACTSMFDQHVASIALLQRVKALEPGILTVIGGANCAGPMGRATFLSFPAVDFTVTGEFDQFAVDFFGALIAAGGDAAGVAPLPPNVLGPADRQDGRRNAPLPPAAILTDMDSAAIPDYGDFFEQIYSSPISRYVRPALPIETSRGCWWGAKQHCTFCGLNAEGMAFRKKSPARALKEIRTLTSTYGVFRLAASDNIIDMTYFQSVLPALREDGKSYNLFYETKANLKREHLQAMADAGCSSIQPGIESLHDETLRIMKKGITACTNIQLLKYCLELGIMPEWNILCGFPGSDPQWVVEIAAELPVLFHLPPANGTFTIRFDRFSPYHQRPEEYGLELEPLPSYRKVYPLDDAVLKDLAYFFRHVGGLSADVSRSLHVAAAATERWKAEFFGPQQPLLEIESDDGETIRIRDTRSCATAGSHELRGRLAMMLRALESPASRQGISTRLQEAGCAPNGEGDVATGLEELRERRLIWRSSSQFVALPTPPAKRPMPGKDDPPFGKTDLAKYLTEKARFSLRTTKAAPLAASEAGRDSGILVV